ncbi:MAG: manganese efflux pump [Clostridia bacterium]|nr:manganese efflux pump [Clostridia bacterium]
MTVLDVILIGAVLAIDAFAITLANCTTYKNCIKGKKGFVLPITFAIFQGVMPLLGYFVGLLINLASNGFIEKISGYITFAIFFILATKIIVDNVKKLVCKCEEEDTACACPENAKLTIGILLLQGLATSIDAFAVGLTFITTTFSVYIAVLIIALITFVLVLLALFAGKYLGKIFGKYAEWVGAVILLALAIKALIGAI